MERVDERVEVDDEDDLEVKERPRKAEAPTQQGAFNCPECREGFRTPEDLGVHLERHAPVQAQNDHPHRRIRMTLCPKGCGRLLPRARGTDNVKLHARNCDGSPPIVGAAAKTEETGKPQKEDQVASLKCKKCYRKFTHQGWLDKHEPMCGKAAATPSPKAQALAERLKADREPAGEEKKEPEEREPLVVADRDPLPIRQRVLDLLELEEDRLAKELGKTKSLIAAVRNAVPEEKAEEPA